MRGKLLANAAVAEVQRRFLRQADKARLAVEKLQAEWEAMQTPRKVRMRLGVSFLLAFSSMFRADRCVGNHCARECGGGVVKVEGA